VCGSYGWMMGKAGYKCQLGRPLIGKEVSHDAMRQQFN
jgi:hypothetical protein